MRPRRRFRQAFVTSPRVLGSVFGPVIGVGLAVLVGFDWRLADPGPLGLPLQELGFFLVFAGFGAALIRAGVRRRWEIIAGGLAMVTITVITILAPLGEPGSTVSVPVADFWAGGALGMVGVLLAVLYNAVLASDIGAPVHVPRSAIILGLGLGALLYLVWSPTPTRYGSTTAFLVGIIADLVWHMGGPTLIGIVVATLALDYRLLTPAVLTLSLGAIAVSGVGTGTTILDPTPAVFTVDWILVLGVVLAPAGLERVPTGRRETRSRRG